MALTLHRLSGGEQHRVSAAAKPNWVVHVQARRVVIDVVNNAARAPEKDQSMQGRKKRPGGQTAESLARGRDACHREVDAPGAAAHLDIDVNHR